MKLLCDGVRRLVEMLLVEPLPVLPPTFEAGLKREHLTVVWVGPRLAALGEVVGVAETWPATSSASSSLTTHLRPSARPCSSSAAVWPS